MYTQHNRWMLKIVGSSSSARIEIDALISPIRTWTCVEARNWALRHRCLARAQRASECNNDNTIPSLSENYISGASERRILAVTYDDYDNTIWNWADCIFSLEWWICVIRWNFSIDLKSVHTIPQLSQRALALRWNMKNHLNIFIYALLLLFQFKTESSMMIQTLFRQQCIAPTTTSFSVQQLETRMRGGKENVSLELIETLRCCGFLFLSAFFFVGLNILRAFLT